MNVSASLFVYIFSKLIIYLIVVELFRHSPGHTFIVKLPSESRDL